MDKFRLTDNFIAGYKTRKPPFGFNGLGELVFLRTYSRIKADGKNENWWETVQRVVEGTFNMQKKWIEGHQLGWNSMKAQKSALCAGAIKGRLPGGSGGMTAPSGPGRAVKSTT